MGPNIAGQGDARRTGERRIVHVDDVGEREALLDAPIPDDQRIAAIQHLIDEIEQHLSHDEIADDRHERRRDQEWERLDGRR